MTDIYLNFDTSRTSCILVAAMAASVLITACATPPIVVKTDPSLALDHIRSVYVMPFASPNDNRHVERIMTQALREQLQVDGIARVVDQPGLADTYVQETIPAGLHRQEAPGDGGHRGALSGRRVHRRFDPSMYDSASGDRANFAPRADGQTA